MPRTKVHDAALRERLLSRAGALLSGGGVEALSLRTLATDCGTSTTAVYALFGGKSALLAAVLEKGVRRLRERLAAVEATDPVDRLLRLGQEYRATALEDPQLYRVLVDGPPVAEALAPLADGVHRAADAGALRAGTDPSTVALAVQALVHGLIALELRGMAAAGTFTRALDAALESWRAR